MSACDRRAFLACGGSALAALALGGCASLVTAHVPPRDGRIRLPLRDYPALAEPGGYLKVLPVGASQPVYVLSLADGTLAALSPICTHQGCTVDIQGPRLVCPCHGSTYDRSGAVLQGPAERPLARFRVDRQDEVVTVHLENGP